MIPSPAPWPSPDTYPGPIARAHGNVWLIDNPMRNDTPEIVSTPQVCAAMRKLQLRRLRSESQERRR
jgi:hypothetical protein